MKSSDSLDVLIIAGEASGDNLGAPLMRQMQQALPGVVTFWGTGGDRMMEAGLDAMVHIRDLEAIGVEILWKLRYFLGLVKLIAKKAVTRQTKLAILIDYPGFNLKLAEALKERGVPVIFYVAPQIWAWRYQRVKKIRRFVDLLLLLYEFEKEIFTREKIPNVVVGHPLSIWIPQQLQSSLPIENHFSSRLTGKRLVVLMPGSRSSEIRSLLPVFLETARIIRISHPDVEFVLPYNNKKMEAEILRQCDSFQIQAIWDQAISAIASADLVILASGTATLEVAYFQKPMIIAYTVGTLSYHIFKRLIRIPHIGLVNILSKKKIVPEFIQKEVTSTALAGEAAALLENVDGQRDQMIQDLSFVRAELMSRNPEKESAQAVLQFIRERLS